MKFSALLLMTIATGAYARILEDAPAPAPSVYGYNSDMVDQEGGVEMIRSLAENDHIRLHNNCGDSMSVYTSSVVVALKHPHFQCGVVPNILVNAHKFVDVPVWGVQPFMARVGLRAFDSDGRLLPSMSYNSVRNWMIKERLANGIPMPGARDGAMDQCEHDKMWSYVDVSGIRDVYVCNPKK